MQDRVRYFRVPNQILNDLRGGANSPAAQQRIHRFFTQTSGVVRRTTPPLWSTTAISPGRIVSALEGPSRYRKAAIAILTDHSDKVAVSVIASAFAIAKIYSDALELGDALKRVISPGLPTDVVAAPPGIPADVLPQGLVYSEGPCRNWGQSPSPVPMTDGAITPCFAVSRNLAGISDEATSAALSGGQTVFLNANTTGSTWRNYAWVSNPLAPSTVIWNSQIHGLANPKPGLQLAELLNDQFKVLCARCNLPTPQIDFAGALQPAGGGTTIPSRNNWWLQSPLRVPVRLGRKAGVQLPQGGTGPGTEVKVPPPPPPPPPVTNPPPPLFRPFQPRLRTVKRYTRHMRAVNRVVGKAGPGIREAKANVAKAVSTALDAMGGLSEVGDDIDAWYKSLPASIRREALRENGKSLTFADKLRVLLEHVNDIDVEKGVAGMLTSRIDDFVAASVSQPFDKALQVAVPDYLTRMGVRQAVRWAYWKSGAESPIPQAPSSQRLLPERYRQEPMVQKKHQNY